MSRNRSHLPHTRRRHNRPHRHSCLFQPKTKIGWCKCLLLIWKHRLWSSCLLVVELKRSEVFPRLWELSFLHPLSNKPESWLLNGRQARKRCVQASQNVKLYQWTNALFAYIRSNLWSSLKSQDDYWPMSRYLFTRGTLPKPPWWLWYWRGSTQPYNFFNVFQILKIIHLDISSTTELVKIF